MTKKLKPGGPSMRAAPPIRRGNLCSRPGCENEKQPPGKYAHTENDPFCSTQCCRLWYGTSEAAKGLSS